MSGFFKKIFGGFSASRIEKTFDIETDPTQSSRCKFCGQTIVWKDLKNGRRWPFNTRKVNCADDEGNIFLAWVPHFQTCRKWRHKRKRS
ncbi:MAG: hypothetical protein CVU78_02870 [Elusimicrobia bacterium HGW-Elusimicrobia-2]|nr:MAG: hypothetical protein CVU78_02870 [Elusimicrobia bacterium HGW-Elusimicrobia-2]